MNFTRIAVLASLGALGLVACDDTSADDSGPIDTSPPDTTYEGPWQIADVEWSCDIAAGTWRYYAKTDGWAGGVTVSIHETGSSVPWTELDHELGQTEWDADGAWDEYERILTEVDTPGEVNPSSTTLFKCGVHADDSLTWIAEMWDVDAPTTRVDCLVWGHQPSYWTSMSGNGDCFVP